MIDEAELAKVMCDYRDVMERNEKLELIAVAARLYLNAAVCGEVIEVENTMFALNKALNAIHMAVPELKKT